ncbi:MAG TPA: ComC/BlpC family leader-containing pheromone/bacteriocin [Dictyobacter sp.]|jgi:bacteriocin-like protein|nr:ComC/BlpC family leader-containing pheromone/bacteriocin [Dictyobacter sp.]
MANKNIKAEQNFEELTDEQLDQVTGGAGLLGLGGTVSDTVSTATGLVGGATELLGGVVSNAAVGVQVSTPVAGVDAGVKL